MATKDDCIFCKIANHQIESDYVYEDGLVCAFRDMDPQAPVHVLIVPKQHYDDIIDDVPADTLVAMRRAIAEVARREGVDASGFRIIANTGADGGQTVRHLHMHLLGGRSLGAAILPES